MCAAVGSGSGVCSLDEAVGEGVVAAGDGDGDQRRVRGQLRHPVAVIRDVILGVAARVNSHRPQPRELHCSALHYFVI